MPQTKYSVILKDGSEETFTKAGILLVRAIIFWFDIPKGFVHFEIWDIILILRDWKLRRI